MSLPEDTFGYGDVPVGEVVQKLRERHENYQRNVLDSRPFQDALRETKKLAADFVLAFNYVQLQGTRFSAHDDFLIFRFAPSLFESIISVQTLAHEGLQSAARRELRFFLEATVKMSSRDYCKEASNFESRLTGLGDTEKRFKDYVDSLTYFDGFEAPDEANADALSLYSQLSSFVHASVPQFETAMNRSRRGETAGMESVATLNRFNTLFFQVLDIAVVRVYHSIGLGLAGDTFVQCLDDAPNWRFHKGKYTQRMSRCFDYKCERQHQK